MLFNKNENKPASSIEEKIKLYRRQGHIVPPRKIIKNAEQIEAIRQSAKINTAVLDHVAANIREGMSTEDINTLVYDFTLAHGAIPAPLNYEGFPKSVCTSINEEVCHGIPHRRRMDGLHGEAHGVHRQARRHPPHLQHGKAAFHRSHRRLAL